MDEKQILIKYRNPILDCCKGIGIVFVVMWHCHVLWRTLFTVFYFNLFFFLLAGLMVKPEKIDTLKNWLLYIKKIVVRYAKPYILFNLLFLCFYNLFVKYQIITNDYRYNSVPHLLTINEFLHKAINHFCLISRSELLCGATWFLKSLFWGLFTYSIIMLIFNTVNKYKIFDWIGKYKKLITYLSITLIGTLLIHYTNNRNIFFFFQTLTCLFVGDLLKPYLKKTKISLLSFVLSVVFIFAGVFISYRIPSVIVLSIACFIFVYQLSGFIQKISKPLFNLFIYLGQNTIPILVFHFISFKLVTLLYINVHNLAIENIGMWPIMFNSNGSEISNWWRILYLIVGIIVPLLLLQTYHHIGNVVQSLVNTKFNKCGRT